ASVHPILYRIRGGGRDDGRRPRGCRPSCDGAGRPRYPKAFAAADLRARQDVLRSHSGDRVPLATGRATRRAALGAPFHAPRRGGWLPARAALERVASPRPPCRRGRRAASDDRGDAAARARGWGQDADVMLRCVYTDLDNTMLGKGASMLRDADGNFSLRVIRALEACDRAGVEVVINSGRRKAQVYEDARLIAQPAYAYEMGCGLVDGPEEVFLTGSIEPRPDCTVYEQIDESGAPALLLEA